MCLAGSTPDLSLLLWGHGDLKQLPSRAPLITHPCLKPPVPHSQQELIHQPPGSRQEGRDGLGGGERKYTVSPGVPSLHQRPCPGLPPPPPAAGSAESCSGKFLL